MKHVTPPSPFRPLSLSGDELSKRGLDALFELHLEQVVETIQWLKMTKNADQRVCHILQFACTPPDFDSLEHFINNLGHKSDDLLAAALMVGMQWIWEESNDFDRFSRYQEAAILMIDENNISSLAKAALLLQCCWSECAWNCDLSKLNTLLTSLQTAAEQARSPSLILMHAAMAVYINGWQGDIEKAALLLQDSMPYLKDPAASPIAQLQFHSSHGLLLTLQGNKELAEKIFDAILAEPGLEKLPPSVWLLVQSNALHCLVLGSNRRAITAHAEELLNRTVPEQLHYYHSYLHFNLALAELATGNPHKALLHSRIAQDRGKLCGSVNACRMPALLEIQSLIDQGDHNRAIELFHHWLPVWIQSRFFLIAAQGYLELATLNCRLNLFSKAKEALEQARCLTPMGANVPVIYRGKDFLQDLEQKIAQVAVEKQTQVTPVYIQTLGRFALFVKGNEVDASSWLGSRSATLLQSIISLGGDGVPVNRVADLLWPDTDGDQSLSAFKVTLSRLRANLNKHFSGNWLKVKNNTVSINSKVVSVDALLFSQKCAKSTKGAPLDELRESLLLYQGEFLRNSLDEPWIFFRREALKKDYRTLVVVLCNRLKECNRRRHEALYLREALDRLPADEELFAQLMESYLSQGFPTKAEEVFEWAARELKQQYNNTPGPVLRNLANQATQVVSCGI